MPRLRCQRTATASLSPALADGPQFEGTVTPLDSAGHSGFGFSIPVQSVIGALIGFTDRAVARAAAGWSRRQAR